MFLTPVLLLDAAGCGGLIAEQEPIADNPISPPTPDAGTKPPKPPKPDAGPTPTPPLSIDFGACTDPFVDECATVQLPLDRNAPSGATIGIFVTRFADPPNARGSLWFLQGGPGGSIAAFTQAMQAYRELFPDLTLYGMEHRGVARSTRLDCTSTSCADELAQSPGLDELKLYSTTAAAADLHALIGLTSQPAQPTYVYGVSYGTFVAQRYLSMFPSEPAAVVLDSVVPEDGLYFSNADREGEYPFKYWAKLCDEDAFCKGQMGTPSLTKANAILASIAAGHCADSGLSKDTSVLLRGTLLYNELGFTLMALLHRFERCNPDDITFIQAYLQRLDGILASSGSSIHAPRFGPDDEDLNGALYMNVAFSELWETPAPSQVELLSRYQAALLPSGGIDELGRLQATWPVYPHDSFHGTYPVTTVPVLTLNGTLDSQTPLDLVRSVGEHYTQPNQSFVVIPNANHGTAVAFDGQPIPCGLTIMQGFLQDPRAPLDTQCTLSPVPVSFEGDPEFNQYVFGTEDLWEGVVSPNQPRRSVSAALRATIDELEARRRLLGQSMR